MMRKGKIVVSINERDVLDSPLTSYKGIFIIIDGNWRQTTKPTHDAISRV